MAKKEKWRNDTLCRLEKSYQGMDEVYLKRDKNTIFNNRQGPSYIGKLYLSDNNYKIDLDELARDTVKPVVSWVIRDVLKTPKV